LPRVYTFSRPPVLINVVIRKYRDLFVGAD